MLQTNGHTNGARFAVRAPGILILGILASGCTATSPNRAASAPTILASSEPEAYAGDGTENERAAKSAAFEAAPAPSLPADLAEQRSPSFQTGGDWEEDDDDEGGFGVDDAGLRSTYILPAKIEGGDGDVSIAQAALEIAFEYEAGNGIELSLGGEYLREEWDYSGVGSGLLTGVPRPWDSFEMYGVELGLNWELDDRWSTLATIGTSWAAEREGPTSDERLLEYSFGVGWRATERLELLAFVMVDENHEGSDEVLPLLGFDWQISDRDRLGLGERGLIYSRSVSDTLSFNAAVNYEQQSFRLASNGPVPGGALEREGLLAGVGVDWTLGPGVLSLGVGFSVGSAIEVFDGDGSRIEDVDLGSAPYAALSYQFGVGY
ncbi:MAG: hypothetical protein GC161_11295 [Planctomycetaceae bacterium]|nr:hypothetical protein [Planctomycetaceae bacterium]